MSKLRTHAAAVVVAVLFPLVLTACGRGGPADPSEAVADAFRRTFSQPFTFHVALDSDERSRDSLPDQMAVLLGTASIQGRRGEQGNEWSLEVLGVKVFEQRQVGTTTYVRLDVPTITGALGRDFDVADLRRELATGNPDPKVGALIDQVLAGRWVGFELGADQGAGLLPFSFGLQTGDVGGRIRERLGPTLEEFLTRFVVVTELPSQDDRRFALDLKARDIARAFLDVMRDMAGGFGAVTPPDDEAMEHDLAEVPERLSGVTAVVSDRLVRRVEVDVLEMARAVDQHAPEGRLALVADFGETADFPLQAPDGALVIGRDELAGLMGGMACPMCTADPEG